jgi:hypothetical protein
MSNTILVGYSPNDFFYADADSQGIMPNETECAAMKPYSLTWDTSCNSIYFPDMSGNCIDKELCKNKDYVTKLYNIEHLHSGSNEKFFNVKDEYETLFMNTVNLGIGCIFLGIIVSRNR